MGALALGLLAARVGSFRIVSATMAAGALATVAFALLAHGRDLSMALALVVGYFIFGAMVGLYAIVPAVYPTELRNTGAGLAIGVGRCGAILSPFLAGVLLEAGWTPSSAYLAFGAPLLVAAAATVVLGRLQATRPSWRSGAIPPLGARGRPAYDEARRSRGERGEGVQGRRIEQRVPARHPLGWLAQQQALDRGLELLAGEGARNGRHRADLVGNVPRRKLGAQLADEARTQLVVEHGALGEHHEQQQLPGPPCASSRWTTRLSLIAGSSSTTL